jgi:hypothetical protein
MEAKSMVQATEELIMKLMTRGVRLMVTASQAQSLLLRRNTSRKWRKKKNQSKKRRRKKNT